MVQILEKKQKRQVIDVHNQSDGYKTHYRFWGELEGKDVIVMLHGGISHSEWQYPLAEAVVGHSSTSFVALDRRGSGLNTQERGHLLSVEREVEDVITSLALFKEHFDRVHLAGWCFGGQVATVVAPYASAKNLISSLILVSPGFVFSERYSDVLKLSLQAVTNVVSTFELEPPKDFPFIPVPLQDIDFTCDTRWLQYIANDDLKLKCVSQQTFDVWFEIARRANSNAFADVDTVPVLAVFGRNDRLVDGDASSAKLKREVQPSKLKLHFLDAPHAIQFHDPDNLAFIVTEFISSHSE